MQPQRSALGFDDHLPHNKPVCVCVYIFDHFLTGSILFFTDTVSRHPQKCVRPESRKETFSKAFQFDIFNIPLPVQVSHD